MWLKKRTSQDYWESNNPHAICQKHPAWREGKQGDLRLRGESRVRAKLGAPGPQSDGSVALAPYAIQTSKALCEMYWNGCWIEVADEDYPLCPEDA